MWSEKEGCGATLLSEAEGTDILILSQNIDPCINNLIFDGYYAGNNLRSNRTIMFIPLVVYSIE